MPVMEGAGAAAGVPEDKARKAAEAIASYENRFSKIEGDLLVLKWMVGFGIALDVAVMIRVFFR
jgi:hypothetical protein